MLQSDIDQRIIVKCQGQQYRLRRGRRSIYQVAFLLILLVIVTLPYTIANWSPYDVLGVKKDASFDQIKRAYRELARKLHPDKTNNPREEDSGRKFIEINKAFNILKDPTKRNRFDQYGETDDNRHSRNSYQNGHQHQNRQTREYWSHNGFRTFTFTTASESHLRKKSIRAKQYYNEFLKESKRKPFFIFFFSDFCPSCMMLESTWAKITDELAKYNVGSFAINVNHESRLARELGVSSIPYIACLLDSQISYYHRREISLSTIVKFVKDLLPNNLVPILRTEYDQDRFVAFDPQFNRLSAIIINDERNLKLRYLLLAYELRQYYRFAHVSTKLSEFESLAKQYNITVDDQPLVLVFDELTKGPSISYVTQDGNLNDLRKELIQWPFLKLQRLSSQQKFDDLCLFAIPREGDKTQKRLCVVLFVGQTPFYSQARHNMIEFIRTNHLEKDPKIVFAYIDPAKQQDFVQTLISETVSTQPDFIKNTVDFSLILFERHPQHNRKAFHKWINARWNPKLLDELDRAKVELYQHITKYKQGSYSLEAKVALNLLLDEESPSLMDRIVRRCISIASRTVDYLTSRESFSTILILIVCASLTSLYLYSSPLSMHLPEQSMVRNFGMDSSSSMKSAGRDQKSSPNSAKPTPIQTSMDGLKLIELKAETYNGMVNLLKPGCRSIILLVDGESKDQLLENFKKAVWPYRRNKTLLFGYLCLDKNLKWYKSLLEEMLATEELNVNKKNCIGTVLSLNGFKKYLRMYHAKHHEKDYYYNNQAKSDGSFLGLEDNDKEEGNDIEKVSQVASHETVYTVDNLLDGLPIWLDKMFDGLTKRYFIEVWPEGME